jgi:hypothetical protein
MSFLYLVMVNAVRNFSAPPVSVVNNQRGEGTAGGDVNGGLRGTGDQGLTVFAVTAANYQSAV